MAIGTYTDIRFNDTKENLEKLAQYLIGADDTIEFFDHVFEIDSCILEGEEYEEYCKTLGVTSLAQSSIDSSEVSEDEKSPTGYTLRILMYTVPEVPLGGLKKIIEIFPDISAWGFVWRETNEDLYIDISIDDGEIEYEPEYLDPDNPFYTED